MGAKPSIEQSKRIRNDSKKQQTTTNLDKMEEDTKIKKENEPKTIEQKGGGVQQAGGKKNKKMNKISLCIENSLEEFNKTTSNPELFLGKVKKSSKRSNKRK